MPDGEYSPMNAVEPTGPQSARTPLAMNTSVLQLTQRDDAVLPGRNPGDDGIRADGGAFCLHGDA